MAVTETFWYDALLPGEVAGYDIHVVATAGASQRLNRSFLLTYDTPDPDDPAHTISQQKSAFNARADGIKVIFEAQCFLDPPAAGSSKRPIPSLNATFDTEHDTHATFSLDTTSPPKMPASRKRRITDMALELGDIRGAVAVEGVSAIDVLRGNEAQHRHCANACQPNKTRAFLSASI